MNPSELRVEALRGRLTESVHRVAVAVVHADGRLFASSGDPGYLTWWRSAAKPFQAMPMVEDGAAEHFGLGPPELALACASHSSEPVHLQAIDRFMAKVGIQEHDLACGIHTPISAEVAKAVTCGTAAMTPKWSNCSGKHTGMLALAKHRGWALEGYNEAGHPVQERILDVLAEWTDVRREAIAVAPDGCAAACFGLPLRNMALAYARLGASEAKAPRLLTRAMMTHPVLVAGSGRLCTDLMSEWPGNIIAKVGADGIYCAALRWTKLGVALKVLDGDGKASVVALLEVLRQILERGAMANSAAYSLEALASYARTPLINTRGTVTGELCPAGALQFYDV